MRKSYRALGQYIQPVDIRNKDLNVSLLLGVSVQKEFIPSIANTVGTDFTKYKIVKKNQFTYIPDTSRRGDKIGLAMLDKHDEAIVSQAYTVFEIIDHSELNPEYLMMWFRRPEFDRYARFKSHGSVREVFDWDEMCEVELPIPTIEKQRAIVAEYNTVVNRIKLNEQLNQKLEETAQTIYRHWFVDFEFPYDFEKGEPALDGQPYKSSGGEMIWCEELEKEIPKGWDVGVLFDLMDFNNGKSRPETAGEFPVYGGNGIMDWVNDWNEEDLIVIGRVGAYCGSLYRITDKCWISDNAICGKSKHGYHYYCFDLLKSLGLNQKSEGSGQPLLTQTILNEIQVLVPSKDVQSTYESMIKLVYQNFDLLKRENENLRELVELLLSKMSTVESLKNEVLP